MLNFQQPKSTRRWGTNHAGRLRGGKLVPLSAMAVEQSESGTVTQTVTLALDPISGSMITQIGVELVSVYVPNLAIHALDNPELDLADAPDLYRSKLLDGQIMSGLELEGELTKRMNLKPKSINGQKKLRKSARLAYIAAWNYLARKKHREAEQKDKTEVGVLPALYSSTALDLLNGVLDPDDRINGQVNLDIPQVNLPVSGIGFGGVNAGPGLVNSQQTGKKTVNAHSRLIPYGEAGSANLLVQTDPEGGQYPWIHALFDGTSQSLSLDDLWRAERSDEITRALDDLMRRDPKYGEELALRMAYGVSMNMSAQPQVIYHSEQAFSKPVVQRATDGPSMDEEVRSHMAYRQSFSAVIPSTEFGGVVITMVAVKPDETLGQQPDPVFSEPLQRIDYIPEELTFDPRKVYVRDLDADCAQADENTVVMYTGLNQLMRNYSVHGLDRHVDPTTVANKNALWQIELPLSVSPGTVAYPDFVDHYPFVLNGPSVEPINYHIAAFASFNTPRQFGPTPIENIDILEEDVFQPIEEEQV